MCIKKNITSNIVKSLFIFFNSSEKTKFVRFSSRRSFKDNPRKHFF